MPSSSVGCSRNNHLSSSSTASLVWVTAALATLADDLRRITGSSSCAPELVICYDSLQVPQPVGGPGADRCPRPISATLSSAADPRREPGGEHERANQFLNHDDCPKSL